MNKMSVSRKTAIIWGILVILCSCGQVARADFVYGVPTKVPNINGYPTEESEPQISRDGLELYFLSDRADAKGEVSDNIWVSKRSTTRDSWSSPIKLDAPVNTTGVENAPSLSTDGLELYFSNGWYSSPAKLYVSTRAGKTDPWGPPVELAPPVNSECKQDCPCISADGLSLYFMSDRPGGGNNPSNSDIFVTTRTTKDGPWGEPVKLGPTVNSDQYEYTPFISPDGLSLFFARGYSKAHIHVCRRRTTADPWGPAEFFAPVNSGTGVFSGMPGLSEWNLSFSNDDPTLYFSRATDLFSNDFDIWQVEVIPILDFNGDGNIDATDMMSLIDNWGTDNTLYDIGPFAWGDGIVGAQDLAVLGEHMDVRGPVVVHSPGANTTEVPCDVVLSWTPGDFAQTHDVYFGTALEAVMNADRNAPLNVLVTQGQDPNTYDPPGLLEFGQTYYWRIDEVGVAPDFAIYRGPVLSFTTEPFARPIQGIVAQASSSQGGSRPEKTVDGSGLDASDGHSTTNTDMWQSAAAAGPHWIQFELGKVYTLHELWVWNSNQVIEPLVGFGAKTVKIEYSSDGTTWTALEGVPEFARAPGKPSYVADTKISFAGVQARYVKLTIEKGWGATPSVGLSEVRFFYIPDRSATNL
jgi:hypothetical protein